MKRRIWFIDALRFRYGITVEGSINTIKNLKQTLEILGCVVESDEEYRESVY